MPERRGSFKQKTYLPCSFCPATLPASYCTHEATARNHGRLRAGA